MRALATEGCSPQKIADETGLCLSRVYKSLRELGLPTNARPVPGTPRHRRIHRMSGMGVPSDEIGYLLRLAPQLVETVLSEDPL